MYPAYYSVIQACLVVKISEVDHSKQTENTQNWHKKISEEWKHISLIRKKHLKTYLILL